MERYLNYLQEQKDPYMSLLSKVRVYPLFSLTDAGEPMNTYRKNGIIPLFEVPGTGHDIIAYHPKKNVYVFFHDDSEDISASDKDLRKLLRKVNIG